MVYGEEVRCGAKAGKKRLPRYLWERIPLSGAVSCKRCTPGSKRKIENFKPNQLTIGLDLGDRSSRYCILNEAGEVILEQELATTPKGFQQVFGKIPRSGIALETGTHSPWISRQLTELGHEVLAQI